MPGRERTVLRRVTVGDLKTEQARLGGPGRGFADFKRCDLSGAKLCDIDAESFDFRGSRLRGIDAANTRMFQSDFTAADLSGATLIGTNFAESTMCKTVLRNANLAGAYFEDADMRGADLRGAILDWADFTDVRVNHTTRVRPEQLALARNVPARMMAVARSVAEAEDGKHAETRHSSRAKRSRSQPPHQR